jgi:hypothetical protein
MGSYLFTISDGIENKILGKNSFLSKKIRIVPAYKNHNDHFEKYDYEHSFICILKQKTRKMLSEKKNRMKLLCAFLFTFFIVSALNWCYTKRPQAFYNDFIGDTAVYLSKQDVRDLEADGNIIINYRGNKSPMYEYIGDAARDEFIRRMISMGIWSGMAVSAALGTILMWTTEKKEQQETK